jgi:hypothetical protein
MERAATPELHGGNGVLAAADEHHLLALAVRLAGAKSISSRRQEHQQGPGCLAAQGGIERDGKERERERERENFY